MFETILSLAISFTATFLAIPVVIKVAQMKKLYDVPDERKVHLNPIPSLGGLGIFAGFLFGILLSTPFTKTPEMQYFIAASLVIFFLGIKDDIVVLSPIKKFIGQVFAAFIIVYLGNIQITSMHGFLGIHELPTSISLILTYFTIIVIINSFNLIDGIDGLAASLGILSTSILGLYMYQVGETSYAVLALALVGSLFGFIIYNFQPARIFMGDTGSLLLGLVNAILVIKFIQLGTTPGISVPVAAAPAMAFALLMIPLLDTLRVFAIRMFQRRSPFSPDRNHIHHLMLDKGLNHRTITLSLVAFNGLVILVAYYLQPIGCTWLIAGIVALFFTGITALYFTTRKQRLFVATKSAASKSNQRTTKILPLTNDAVLEKK